MKNLFPALCTAFLFAACGGDAPKTATLPVGGNTGPVEPPDDGHGAKNPLGNLTIGAHTFAVIQFGPIEAGHEGAVELEFDAGKPLPSTVRGWIGVESGTGSMKGKLGKEGETTLHGHIEVPKPIPAGSKLWIEIEEVGKAQKGSIAFHP